MAAKTYEFSEIGEVTDALREHIILNKADFPEHLRDRLVAMSKTGVSPVDFAAGFVDAVYANSGEFNVDTKRLAAATADLISMKGYHGQMGGRANGISNALRRDSGLKAPVDRNWPGKDKDPAPNPVFATPVEEATGDGS